MDQFLSQQEGRIDLRHLTRQLTVHLVVHPKKNCHLKIHKFADSCSAQPERVPFIKMNIIEVSFKTENMTFFFKKID